MHGVAFFSCSIYQYKIIHLYPLSSVGLKAETKRRACHFTDRGPEDKFTQHSTSAAPLLGKKQPSWLKGGRLSFEILGKTQCVSTEMIHTFSCRTVSEKSLDDEAGHMHMGLCSSAFKHGDLGALTLKPDPQESGTFMYRHTQHNLSTSLWAKEAGCRLLGLF